MNKRLVFLFIWVAAAVMVVQTNAETAEASVIGITPLEGSEAVDYVIGTPESLPFTLTRNFSNDDTLYVWDEVQNFTVPGNLFVDRVADPTASFIGGSEDNYYIEAGTIVSSHYVQWDPLAQKSVQAVLEFDSEIFAFITADNKLADSDLWLGLPGIDYGDFGNRGLEYADTTEFNASNVEINWRAQKPGDWSRLITAESPVPIPGAVWLLGSGLIGLVGIKRKFKK